MADLKFKAVLDSTGVTEKLDGMKSRMGAVQKAAIAMGAALAASGAALATIAVTSIRAAGEMNKLARVSNTGSKDFQKWAFAARTVGVEQDKLADILKDTTDKIGDFASTGAGPMKDFFEQIAPKIGLTTDAFKGLSGPDALQLYVSSLEKAGVSQQQMTFYMEALASDASLLIPLLQNNGSAAAELAQRYTDLGISLDENAVQSMTRANEAMIILGMAFEGIGNRIGAALAPAIENVVVGFTNMLAAGEPLRIMIDFLINNITRFATYLATFAVGIATYYLAPMALALASTVTLSGALTFLRGALMRTGFGALVVVAGELVFQFMKLVDAAGGFGNAMAAISAVASEVWGRVKQGAALMGEALYAVALKIGAEFSNAWVTVLEGFSSLLSKIQGGINSIKTALNEAFTIKIPEIDLGPLGKFGGQTLDGLGLEASTFADEYAGVVAGQRAAADNLAESAKVYAESVSNSAADLMAPLESMKAFQSVIDSAKNATTGTNTTTPGGGAGVPYTDPSAGGGAGGAGKKAKVDKPELTPIQEWVKQMQDGATAIANTVSSAYQNMEDSLINFVKTGKLDFSSLIDSMISDILRMMLRSAIFGNGTTSGPMGWLSSVLGAVGGGAPVASRLGNAFGSTGQLNFAKGGVFNQRFAMPMADGRTAIGAEAGPEAIMPLSRGKDGKLGVQMNGGANSGTVVTINQNINIPQGTDANQAKAISDEMRRGLEKEILNVMAKQQNTYARNKRY